MLTKYHPGHGSAVNSEVEHITYTNQDNCKRYHFLFCNNWWKLWFAPANVMWTQQKPKEQLSSQLFGKSQAIRGILQSGKRPVRWWGVPAHCRSFGATDLLQKLVRMWGLVGGKEEEGRVHEAGPVVGLLKSGWRPASAEPGSASTTPPVPSPVVHAD